MVNFTRSRGSNLLSYVGGRPTKYVYVLVTLLLCGICFYTLRGITIEVIPLENADIDNIVNQRASAELFKKDIVPTVEHKRTVHNHTAGVVPIHDPRPCAPKPPDAMIRHSNAWVHMNNYTVTKFPGFDKFFGYAHEKKVSQMLSQYPNFVTLLSWNDACGLLVFERLFPAKEFPHRMVPKLENWTAVEDQIHDIWEVFERYRIIPSTEFLMGQNNIFIGAEGNVTMFDFHAYRYEGDGHHNPPDFNTTLPLKYKLLEDLRRKRESNHY